MNTKKGLSAADVERFRTDGYVIARGLLDQEEHAIVRRTLTEDPAIRANLWAPTDETGKSTGIVAWNHPGASSYGLLARSERVVSSLEALLGDEVYHYHSKVTAKAPRTGGAWEWHQDFGYWHDFGCPEPAMASVMFAVDGADKGNGCLQVIAGSHRGGLLPHRRRGGQLGVDDVYVQEAMAQGQHVYCELAPGDAVFFHCNTLHRSDANTSDRRRWSLLSSYNTRGNSPQRAHVHPQYTPIERVDDDAITRIGVRYADGADEDFLVSQTERST